MGLLSKIGNNLSLTGCRMLPGDPFYFGRDRSHMHLCFDFPLISLVGMCAFVLGKANCWQLLAPELWEELEGK